MTNPDAMKTLNCNADMCEDEEDACNDGSGWYESSSDGYSSLTKRSYALPNGKLMWSYDRGEIEGEIEERAKPVRPGDPRGVKIYVNAIVGSSLFKNLEIESRAYPTGLNVFKGDGASTLPLQGGFTLARDVCSSTAVQLVKSADLPKKNMHAEHTQELLSGWHQKYDLSLSLAGVEVTDVKGWAAALTPNDRIFEIFGSYSYRTGISVLERELNLAKMRIFLGHRTMGDEPWKKAIAQAAAGHMGGATKVLGNIKETIAVWNYLNYGELRPYLDQARAQVRTEMGYADKYIPDLKGILAAWNEFEPAFYSHIVSTSHNYVSNRIAEIAAKFPQGGSVANEAVTKLVYESEELKKALSQIKFPLTK